MNVAELITELSTQGVKLWSDRNQLKIQAPKGIITPQIRADLVARKTEILTFLQDDCDSLKTPTGLSLPTIGCLIGGFTPHNSPPFKSPIIEPLLMAKKIKVTLRPLPAKFSNSTVSKFREELLNQLTSYGVQIIPWSEATRDFNYKLTLPVINQSKTFTTRVVKPDISAVIDVERPLNQLKSAIAEKLYQIYTLFKGNDRPTSMAAITKLTSWAEDHVMQRLEDPTSTQVILLAELDQSFVNPEVPYQQKIAWGINTLVKTFSEIVIGISDRQISILNMNLADSLFERAGLEQFVLKSLIPKIYVPISPLPLSRFTLDRYQPQTSIYAQRLVQLSRELATTELFPAGFKLAQVIKRQSHRDLVNSIVNGRSGVSYGFVAYAEPPQYIGDRQITQDEWARLEEVEGLSFDQVRQNQLGRRFLKTKIKEQDVFLQIPDIWILSSRSGADKTNLKLERDILRIGLQNKLCLQLPATIDHQVDIKPSYDTYVMLAIALAAALYTPKLIERGAPMIHFHGYPAQDWFEAEEDWAGVEHPSVPCGTYESGVFNFLSIYRLAQRNDNQINLASLIESDHGTNIVTGDLAYLLTRLKTGIERQQIELGGKHFNSLTNNRLM